MGYPTNVIIHRHVYKVVYYVSSVSYLVIFSPSVRKVNQKKNILYMYGFLQSLYSLDPDRNNNKKTLSSVFIYFSKVSRSLFLFWSFVFIVSPLAFCVIIVPVEIPVNGSIKSLISRPAYRAPRRL